MGKYTNIQLAIKGDDCALGQIYTEYKDDLYFYALKLVKNETVAEDIVQDTMVEMFKSIKNLEQPKFFKTWLFRICHNICYHYFAKQTKTFSNVSIDDECSYITDIPDIDSTVSPQAAVEKQELRDVVNEMIDDLPDNQREIVILFYYKDMSISDITDVLQCPSGTVKSSLNYARKKIKSRVQRYEIENSVKLHSVFVGPIIVRVLKATFQECSRPNFIAMYRQVCKAAEVTASATFANTLATTAPVATIGVATSTKIIAGVVAASIVVGGATITGIRVSTEREAVSSLDASTNIIQEVAAQDTNSTVVSVVESNNAILNETTSSTLSSSQPTTSFENTKSSQVQDTSSKEVKKKENESSNTNSSNSSELSDASFKETVKTDEDGVKYFERANDDYCYNDYGDYVILTSYIGTDEYLELPESIEGADIVEISEGCFENNNIIRSITIGGYIDTIGAYAFKGCDALKTVTIGENVASIGDGAFSQCESLTSVYVDGIECELGENVFYECSKVTIYGPINSDIEYYCAENEHKFSEK